jgi:hypothetical protein
LAELALEKHRDAAEHLTASLDHGAALSMAAQRRFQQGRSRAEQHIVRLYLGVNPPDAEVFLDGHPIGRRESTYLLFVEPGKHTVRTRLPGYSDTSDSFEAGKGETRSLALHLSEAPRTTKAAAPAPSPTAAPSATGNKLRIAGIVLSATAVTAARIRCRGPAGRRDRQTPPARPRGLRRSGSRLLARETARRRGRRRARSTASRRARGSRSARGTRPGRRAPSRAR